MSIYFRPDCPDCGMQMIVAKDMILEPERRTYECLRCGHVIKPGDRAKDKTDRQAGGGTASE
jgi:uncharacterized Zn finger protein